MTKQNNDQLQEFFAVPVNPQLVAKLDDLKLYSSNILVSKYRSSLANNKATSSSFKFLNRLIDKQLLTPTYLSKGLLSFSFRKIFGNDMNNICAFYAPDVNRIFVLIDNNTTFGFSSDLYIGRLTIHECMHMACAHGKSKFIKLYYNEFAHFYNIFFHILSNRKPNSQSTKKIAGDIDKYIKIFSDFEIKKKDLSNNAMKAGYTIIHTILKKLDVATDVNKIIQNSYSKLLQLYVSHGVAGIIKALEDPGCKYLMQSLQKTYPAISNNKVNTLAIQELIFPSEISAIFSELSVSANKIPKAISMIKA